jgi:hypothetical protein
MEDYILIPNTENYVAKNLIVKGYSFDNQTKFVHENGALILTPNDSLNLDYALIQGINEKIHIFDGNGNKIESNELSLILDNRHAPTGDWRAESLDAKFKNGQVSFYEFKNGTYTLVTEQLSENTLMVVKRIDLVDFVINPDSHTPQGLPSKVVKEGNFFYFPPTNNTVAGLVAFSDRAYLSCIRDPSNSGDSVGGRAKISTGNLKQFLEELKDKYNKVPKIYFTKERLGKST